MKANLCAAAAPVRVARRPRVFYGCSRYPDCDFTSPHMPIAEPCPKCGAPFIVEKRTKIGTVHACLKEGCDWEKLVPKHSRKRNRRRQSRRWRKALVGMAIMTSPERGEV